MSIREAQIQAELYRALTNVIRRKGEYDHIEFDKVSFEHSIRGIGRADLVLFDKKGIPWLVIETKRPLKTKDPYDPKVIVQALTYGSSLGSYYIATCDGKDFVLFDNREPGVSFWERKRIPPYDLSKVKNLEEFADRLLRDIVQLELGIKKWSPLDEAFVSRLKVLHERFVPLILESMRNALRKDSEFKGKYVTWLDQQGFPSDEETHRKIAIETAYILINKILFYKVLETKYKDLSRLNKIEFLTRELTTKFRERLDECFKEALKIDYRAVFQHGIYDDIPLPQQLVERLNEFLDEASSYDLGKIESDVIGRIYEGLIPKDERHDLGQYYTPPSICDLIVRFCVNDPNAYVLDPGCGSGGFLIKAYYRLLELKGKKEPDDKTHQEILRQLWGIDISQFPAHLSVINLALRNLKAKSDMINIIPNDFFRVLPQQAGLEPLEKLTLEDVQRVLALPPQFDAVVCNPPYTRQEQIGDKIYKGEVRKVALTIDDKKIDMSARAGIYAYFFTHSTQFLKEGGMMGYIVSNSWLDVEFGKDLQKFFLDNFKINTIIEFDRRAFVEAAINTIIIILQKLSGEQKERERNNNFVKFVRIKQPLKTEQIIQLVKDAKETYESDLARVYLKKQDELYNEFKWGKYLRAPLICFNLLKSSKITHLKNIADMHRGVTSGAEKFFFINKETIRRLRLESNFLEPVFRSPSKIRDLELTQENIDECILLVHKEKTELDGTNALRYIQDGEKKNYHNRPTTRSRPRWYDLGDRKPAPILFPRIIWERAHFLWNKVKAFADDAFYEIYPKNKEDIIPTLGVLNSTLASLLIEITGRVPLGEGALELKVYELKELPTLNISMLTKNEKKKIERAFLKVCRAQREGNKDLELEGRKELDNAVFDALELSEDERQQVYDGLVELRKMRKKRKEVELLIEHPETKKRKEKPRQRLIKEYRPSTTLGEWFEES